MPFSVVGLSDQERQMVYKLVDASRQLELIYWHQSDPKGLELLKKMRRMQSGAEPEAASFPDHQWQPL